MTRPAVVIHLPIGCLLGQEHIAPYFHKLRDGLSERKIRVEIEALDRDGLLRRIDGDKDFHIVNHGNFRHPRALNTASAYIAPFWYLDPEGVRLQSSIGERTFDPAAIDPAKAQNFFAALRRRRVSERVSRYPQAEGTEEFPKGAIAVFLQNGAADAGAFFGRREMIDALLSRHDTSPILIKPHPRDDGEDTAELLAVAARDPRVRVTHANIHDILSSARVTVMLNSAVGLESMMHRVPVVLCGPSDFHHSAVTVRDAFDLDAGLAKARLWPWHYAAFLYWFLKVNCVNAGAPDMIDDVLNRIAATGYDVNRLYPQQQRSPAN
ncbi:hypothetical protein OEW28_07035 [Defluviimonas sp. WL0002]|uniref:Capsule polysaccharide biosynthesis protein n=1 Tax=Albidovulum marisflavi TaxID=2984159 RepID=A0ABT2ZB55_9RHOB|nr:hypothetical protein [Defluviimonas sp. WL0002]MCV2868380.1 hypothetical protein [Defluviimonas sp. WL0002]